MRLGDARWWVVMVASALAACTERALDGGATFAAPPDLAVPVDLAAPPPTRMDLAMAPPAGAGIACGSALCGRGQGCCNQNGPACIPVMGPAAACSGDEVTCQGPDDCPVGQLCLLLAPGGNVYTRCSPNNTVNAPVVCKNDGQCANGGCNPIGPAFPGGPSLGLCE